jgi:small subunit ribosomal protein S2
MAQIPSLEEMLKVGIHFGHQKAKWHPKMGPYIFGARNGVHIVDLEQTQKRLTDALTYLSGVAERGGTVLFVGTKRQAQAIVKREAERCGMPYVTERWLGGTLTNFPVIYTLIKTHRDLARQFENGDREKKYTKKEQLMFRRRMEEIEDKAGGILSLDRIPDALFILDLKKEKTAYTEAVAKKLPIVAICDTNVNPTDVTYPIPANDDAVRGIDMLLTVAADAVLEGKAKKAVAPPPSVVAAAPKEVAPAA